MMYANNGKKVLFLLSKLYKGGRLFYKHKVLHWIYVIQF